MKDLGKKNQQGHPGDEKKKDGGVSYFLKSEVAFHTDPGHSPGRECRQSGGTGSVNAGHRTRERIQEHRRNCKSVTNPHPLHSSIIRKRTRDAEKAGNDAWAKERGRRENAKHHFLRYPAKKKAPAGKIWKFYPQEPNKKKEKRGNDDP